MKRLALLGSGFLVAFLYTPVFAQTPTATPDCEAVRCQVQAQINACATPAAGAKFNHGRYVSCVTRTINTLAKNGTIPTSCKGKIVRCAARSTFGKSAFETCHLPELGTCSGGLCPDGVTPCTSNQDCPVHGTCTSGLCPDGATACSSDSDCPVVTTCHIVRAFSPHATPTPGQDRCTLEGGTPGSGSCCAACP